LIQPREIAIVALVQGLMLDGFKALLVKLRKHKRKCALSAFERACKGDIENQTLAFKPFAGTASFRDPCWRQVRVAPACEEIELIPLALPMADEYEHIIHLRNSLLTAK